MCGIVGFFGPKKAKDVVIEGLEKLEYRGYDSAGIAFLNKEGIEIYKKKGKIENLKKYIEDEEKKGKKFIENIAIGHTRWATHGEPSDVNAHPQFSYDKKIAIVHNGIIENYLEIKDFLISKGIKFMSSTDTEVIANLIAYQYSVDKGLDFKDVIFKALSKLKGTYALAILNSDIEKLYVFRKDSPLILGIGDEFIHVASDVVAIIGNTNRVVYLENNDLVEISSGSDYSIYNSKDKGKNISEDRKIKEINMQIEDAKKDGYEYFMEKEIFIQKEVLKNPLRRYVKENYDISFDFDISKEILEKINKIYIIGCGTAYHAGLIGKYVMEKYLDQMVIVDIASEARYNKNFIDKNTLVIFISQSGETADTLRVLEDAKKVGAVTLAITNVVGSNIAREAKYTIYQEAGPEISVASTKAYTTQILVLDLLTIYLGRKLGKISKKEAKEYIDNMYELPNIVKKELDNSKKIEKIAEEISKYPDAFYIGRSKDYYSSLEGALKLKEISYINVQALASGELKHGTIALIDNHSVVISISTCEELREKNLSNVEEVIARGAKVYLFTNSKEQEKATKDKLETIYVEETIDMLSPIVTIIPLQLLAYFTSKAKGIDVDKPRNLAKSVTVE